MLDSSKTQWIAVDDVICGCLNDRAHTIIHALPPVVACESPPAKSIFLPLENKNCVWIFAALKVQYFRVMGKETMIQFSFCKLTHNGSLCSLAHSWDPTANHFIPSILPQTRKGASQELIGGAFWVLKNANSKELTKVLLSHLRAGAIRPQRGWQGIYTKVKQFKPLSSSLRNLVRYKRRYGSREKNSYMSKISSNG